MFKDRSLGYVSNIPLKVQHLLDMTFNDTINLIMVTASLAQVLILLIYNYI